jgi:hypothetical protein
MHEWRNMNPGYGLVMKINEKHIETATGGLIPVL